MRKSTLKFGLIGVLLAFVIVPTLLLGLVGTFVTINFSKSVSQNELETVSLTKSGSLDGLFSSYVDSAAALAKDGEVIDNAKSNNNAAQNTIASYKNSSDDYIDVLIVDSNGAVLTSVAGKQTGTFEHLGEGGFTPVSCLLNWESYQEDGFYVSHVISEDNKNLGYVVFVIGVGKNTGIGRALSGTYLNGKGHMALLDADGNAVNIDGVGSVSKAGQGGNPFRNVRNTYFNSENIGTNDNTTMKTDTAGKYTVVYGIIPDINNWRWVGAVDTSAMTDFAETTNIIIWAVVAVICVLCMLITFTIIGKFTNNMNKMIAEMSAIDVDEGVINMRFDTRHDKSELGVIKNSFNEFLDEVYMNGERYRTIAVLSDNMLFEWDFHKERMYVSDNALAKFDLDIKTATLSNGRFLDSLMTPEYAEKYRRDINTLLKNQGSFSSEYQLKTKSGATVWVNCKATCISDRLGDPLRVIGVLIDIDNEKKLEVQLSERASYDFLSQLLNRSTFIKQLSQVLDRRGPNKVATMFIDVDDFKFINDRYGHAVGDEVIKYVADTIRKKVDDRGGMAGRFGGDEFVLCYTNLQDIANLEQIAMDIIDELYVGYTTTDGMLINVRASIGISYCPQHTEDGNQLIAFADTAMYYVKKNGKTNYHVYVPEDSTSGEYNDPEF